MWSSWSLLGSLEFKTLTNKENKLSQLSQSIKKRV